MSKISPIDLVLSGAASLGAIPAGTSRRGQLSPLNPVTGLLGLLGTPDHLVPAGASPNDPVAVG